MLLPSQTRDVFSAHYTDAGMRYAGYNQDACFRFHAPKQPAANADNDALVFRGAWGVFDGHDLLGEVAAKTATAAFKNFFVEFAKSPRELSDKEIDDLFLRVHEEILATYDKAPSTYSFAGETYRLNPATRNYESKSVKRSIEYGTTALVAWALGERVHVAWCGDSRAVVGSKNAKELECVSAAGDFSFAVLTEDHNVGNKAEKERIVKEGKLAIVEGCVDVGRHFISMTRCLGHKMLSPLPDKRSVRVGDCDVFDKVLVLATDGVWGTVGAEHVCHVAFNRDNEADAAEDIVVGAHLNANYPDEQDNATAVVVFL